jgi:hypothetical protein
MPAGDDRPRWNYVPAPDIFGPGGYAADPFALFSHHGGDHGFGGTSAAAAQATGILARLVAARRARGEAADGPAIRKAVVAGLGGPWSATSGYGLLTLAVG